MAAKLSGRASLFRGKRRAPVSITLTPAHHVTVRNNMRRLGLTRADLIGLLIDKYADTVTVASADTKNLVSQKENAMSEGFAYERLRSAVKSLGGNLEHRKPNEPRGGTWVLELGGKRLKMPSEQSERFPILDACYQLKNGVAVSRTWNDHTDDINPAGLAQLFTRLASSED